MRLRTLARDCLYVNWSLPRRFAPAIPLPLRYEEHEDAGESHVFVSALLFRLTELRLGAIPGGRLAYPQANVRVYVRDQDDQPAVFYLRTLVPIWVVPGARFLNRLPVEVGRLRYPRPSRHRGTGAWRWTVGCRVSPPSSLAIHAELTTPLLGPGPRLGPWERTVSHFRSRARGYVLDGAEVRAVAPANASTDVWPLTAEVEDAGLMAATVSEAPTEIWRRPHSSWLCPEVPFRFELGRMADRALRKQSVPVIEGA